MPAGLRILISAGEASGDLYAAQLVTELRRYYPDARFFGCVGPRMRQIGVEEVVDAHRLAVVGLVEVVAHIPRIYGEFRKLCRAAEELRPDVAILTDSPDFHLRLATRLKRLKVPVVYLVAPQVWAWRQGRLKHMRRTLDRLLCIFPFEEEYFRRAGIAADYIGHPLTRIVRPSLSKHVFFQKHRLPLDRPLIVVLPGSRSGEARRHLTALLEAVRQIYKSAAATFVMALAPGVELDVGQAPVKVIRGETWDAIAHADLALAASGTVTVEAAILGTPMVTFYRVTKLSWLLGKMLVRVPYYSMVNLIAGRLVAPELMQNEMNGSRLAGTALGLLGNPEALAKMRRELGEVAGKLASTNNPLETAAQKIREIVDEGKLVTR